MNQLDQKDIKLHVTVLGWLHILGHAIFLVLGVLGYFFMTGIGVATGDLVAMRILSVAGSVGALFFALLALPGLASGYGLVTRKPWAQVLALVVGFFSLINFPLGTVIGIYTFWVLLQQETSNYFVSAKPA